MNTRPFRRARAALASLMILSGLAVSTGIAPKVVSAAGCTGLRAPCLEFDDEPGGGGYRPGQTLYTWFSINNISARYAATNVVVKLDLPDEMSIDVTDDWAVYPPNGSLTYNKSTNVVTFKPESWDANPGVIGPGQDARPWLGLIVDENATAPELTVKATITYTNTSGVAQPTVYSRNWVFGYSKPYVMESTTTFTPDVVASGGASTITSKVSNTGTGSARSIYYYIYVDDRLTVDQASVPADCTFYPQEEWEGQMYQQYLSCHYEGILAPGEFFEVNVNVTAPSVSGPEEYEANTEISCTESSGAAHDETVDGNSAALLRLAPPAAGELHVVQLGGPKPLAMPSATAEPQQPTAGETHSISSYVYNIGQGDISSEVTLVVTIPDGFTPTAIEGTTDDSGATAPVCTLSTRTCVFSKLAAGKHGRISIEGTLSPTIADKTFLDVSSQASATSLTTASDSSKFAVSALANVTLQLTAASAYYSGSPVSFMLTAANNGPSVVKSPVIKVTLPAGATFTTVPKGCTATANTMTCKWSKLEDEGFDGETFAADFGSATKATATAVLTTGTPLSKSSVVKATDSQALATVRAIERVTPDGIITPNGLLSLSGTLPATGSGSAPMTILAMLLLMGGAALILVNPARRRTAK